MTRLGMYLYKINSH